MYKLVEDNVCQIKCYNEAVRVPEYYHSIIAQINAKFYYNIINDELLLCRPVAIMGQWSLMAYILYPFTQDIDNKFTQRGLHLPYATEPKKKDYFEYIYDTESTIKLVGKQFTRFRNMLKRYSTYAECGYDNDVLEVVEAWSKLKKSKHQLKLLKIINKYISVVDINITRVYCEKSDRIIGFSIVERVGQHGIIIQRLINPEIKDLILEPNLIIHYWDCVKNSNLKLLNIGAGRNSAIKVAKEKLRPSQKIQYWKAARSIAPTREEWYKFKNTKVPLVKKK